MTRAQLIRPENVMLYWDGVEPWIAKAIEGSANYPDTIFVLERLMKSDHQLWLLDGGYQLTGAMVTEIYHVPKGKTCELVIAGGLPGAGVQQFLDAADVIEAWARELDCVRMYSEARPGAGRSLKSRGWRRMSEQIEKVL